MSEINTDEFCLLRCSLTKLIWTLENISFHLCDLCGMKYHKDKIYIIFMFLV